MAEPTKAELTAKITSLEAEIQKLLEENKILQAGNPDLEEREQKIADLKDQLKKSNEKLEETVSALEEEKKKHENVQGGSELGGLRIGDSIHRGLGSVEPGEILALSESIPFKEILTRLIAARINSEAFTRGKSPEQIVEELMPLAVAIDQA